MTPGKDTVEEYDFAEYREREGRRMLENGDLTQEEYDALIAAPESKE